MTKLMAALAKARAERDPAAIEARKKRLEALKQVGLLSLRYFLGDDAYLLW